MRYLGVRTRERRLYQRPVVDHARMLQQRVIVITGITSERSLAAGVLSAVLQHGGQPALTYFDERAHKRLERMHAQQCPDAVLVPLDVSDEDTVHEALAAIHEHYGRIDGIVHAIAHGALVDEEGAPLSVLSASDSDWQHTLEVSARSLPMLANSRAALFFRRCQHCCPYL